MSEPTNLPAPAPAQLISRIPPETRQQLKIYAAQTGQSMSRLVERAIKEVILRDGLAPEALS